MRYFAEERHLTQANCQFEGLLRLLSEGHKVKLLHTIIYQGVKGAV